jgi:lysophospholipase L1-like esterase
MRRVVKLLALVSFASFALAACAQDDARTTQSGVLDGIGRLPGYDFWAPVTLPDGVELDLPLPEGGPVGGRVEGNRVLFVGDSILASTAKRYGNEMCEALKPLGWQVAVEAEPGRFAAFGVEVLERRIGAVWDVVFIYLGTNFDGNEESLREQFDKMFEITRGVETVVLTTTEFRDAQKRVNTVIKKSAAGFDHVRVLDWAQVAALKGMTTKDKIHLSDAGRTVLAQTIARSLDYAPYREPLCLDPRFRDDSGINEQSTANP